MQNGEKSTAASKIRIELSKEYAATLEEAKQLLTNLTINFVAKEPNYIKLPATLSNQLEEIYKKLKTYQGVIHITTTSESGTKFDLSLEYNRSNLLRIKAIEEALENSNA